MNYIYGLCEVCGEANNVLESNNKFAKKVCAKCVVDNIDIEDAEEVVKFSLNQQIPFDSKELYTIMLGTPNKVEAMDTYLKHLAKGKGLQDYTYFDWSEINQHYHAAKSYIHVLAEIEPLKKQLIERGQEKWGFELSFAEMMKLEDIYENTIKQFGIDSSIQQDAVKKAAKISVKIDSLIAAGDYKEIKDATSAYSNFLKAANIDDLVEVSSDNTIRTVADLALYVEKQGWVFNTMLPQIERDEIDYLMNNYTENVRSVVLGNTGLEQELRDLIEKQKTNLESKSQGEIAETHILEDDIENFVHEEDIKFENEMKTEVMLEEDWDAFSNYD